MCEAGRNDAGSDVEMSCSDEDFFQLPFDSYIMMMIGDRHSVEFLFSISIFAFQIIIFSFVFYTLAIPSDGG